MLEASDGDRSLQTSDGMGKCFDVLEPTSKQIRLFPGRLLGRRERLREVAVGARLGMSCEAPTIPRSLFSGRLPIPHASLTRGQLGGS